MADAGLRILVVDDEESQRAAITACIDDDHSTLTASDAKEALAAVRDDVVDLVLLDLRLGGSSGLDLIPELIAEAPWVKVVLLTAHASVETAVAAMRAGAIDYLVKPADPQAIRILVERLAATRRLERQVEAMTEDQQSSTPPRMLESADPVMQKVVETARRVAKSEAMVLIRGESGTGKGVLARAIHEDSPRSDNVFAVINCPSLSGELLQSELFGHVKGAFTGAVKSQMGKVELASKGTLFLDEVGDLPGSIQPKLLRFIQEKTYERVGDPRPREADVRIISATNRPLEEMVEAGEFREDLLYRLQVIELEIPPLRDRPKDLVELSDRFLHFFARRSGVRIDGFSDAARERIAEYPWPGNVRELQNAIERAVILCDAPEVPAQLLPES